MDNRELLELMASDLVHETLKKRLKEDKIFAEIWSEFQTTWHMETAHEPKVKVVIE